MANRCKGTAFIALALLAAGAASAQTNVAEALRTGRVVEPSEQKQRMIDLGIEHETAMGLYQHFKEQADGGDMPDRNALPDWSGVWTREASPFYWDPDQVPGTLPTAELTPEYEQMLVEKLELVAQGIEYDPLSECNPAGMPRWLVEPFLKDFALAPHQTWMINEMMNEVRRIYTDGRGHPPEEDSYPLWLGDSIGFWDGDRLIVHTTDMRPGQYQRIQPEYSEEVEVVEVWQKTDDETLVADVWTYDPPALEEPWYTRQVYKKLSNEDKSLRIRYWHCQENQNNVVIRNEDGTSDFADFTFTDEDDDRRSNDTADEDADLPSGIGNR